tara:strand:- start:164 stop:2041 length:1878 start_codon:yes stop_codon:yes gene_type:complete
VAGKEAPAEGAVKDETGRSGEGPPSHQRGMDSPEGWLVLDGYEDEPAAFGVPNYVGFHVRYICGVLESRGIEYTYMTIDEWRIKFKSRLSDPEGMDSVRREMGGLSGAVLLAGAVVPGKYVRGTPISLKETNSLISTLPTNAPILCGGWAIRHWRYDGWTPLRPNLFLTVQDTDATLDHHLSTGEWAHKRRTPEQWSRWALSGASSKAVTEHPDILAPDGTHGPLMYEIELYQGCVRFKRGCKFCIEPKKGLPLWRTESDVIDEISAALDSGVRNVRIGGATDIYTYRAEGVEDLEYPIPNPDPIIRVLSEIREDDRLDVLHVDNANPSIIAENIEQSTEITKAMVEYLSDGSVLSFGLESADPSVHEENWLNCDTDQLMTAIRHINEFGRERGPRGLPAMLPGLNFIAGLNGETAESYGMNMNLLRKIKAQGLLLRRINIRQVEGQGFQEVSESAFRDFKTGVRDEIDQPMLEQMLPAGTILRGVWWESNGNRIRLPEHVMDPKHRDPSVHGSSGITFGRQMGAYPILVGVPYLIPLETGSDVMVTGHGKRSISAVETGLDFSNATQQQLEAIPGIGRKAAWRIVSHRAKMSRKGTPPDSLESLFDGAGIQIPGHAKEVFTSDA